MEAILPVVLAGGSGSRLWPLSRELYPKQFLAFEDGPTLFQKTLRRITGLQAQPVCVVCNNEHRFIVAEQARAIGHPLGAIVLEPAARNTAPAIRWRRSWHVSRGRTRFCWYCRLTIRLTTRRVFARWSEARPPPSRMARS